MQKVKIFKQVDGNYEPVLDCAAQFNPEKLALDKKASWKTEKTWQKNIGNTFFTGGDPISLSVDLFFDTTDSDNGDVRDYTEPLMALTLVNLEEAANVPSPEDMKKRLEEAKKDLASFKESLDSLKEARDAGTIPDEMYQLLAQDYERKEKRVKELEDQAKGLTAGSKAAPPITKFVWGDFSFVAIVESVKVTYTMFRPDGTPVRAKAKVKMKQIEEETFYPPQNPTSRSAPRKVWVVQEGQRLDWIAYQEYGNASMWRYLAEINNLDNPMRLRPGQIIDLI
jgi:hypothetical protein